MNDMRKSTKYFDDAIPFVPDGSGKERPDIMRCGMCQTPITNSNYFKAFWWEGVEPVTLIICQDCYRKNLKKITEVVTSHGGFIYCFGDDL